MLSFQKLADAKVFRDGLTDLPEDLFVVTPEKTLLTYLFQVYVEQFWYNVTDAKDCVPAKDNNSEPNCTKSSNGSFTGFGATDAVVLSDLFSANLWPR